MQLKPISQQVVCIVGASSGIGRQAALDFAKRKAKVVVSARNEVGLKSLVDEIESKVGEAKAITNELEIPSISDWLEMNQALKWGALAASLAAIAFKYK